MKSQSRLLGAVCVVFSVAMFSVPTYAATLAYDISIIPNPNGRGGFGYDINNNNQVVGRFTKLNGEARAFLYENGSVIDLGSLNSDLPYSKAFGINENGVIVGEAVSSTGRYRAFKYENSLMQDLGALNSTDWSSDALAINNHNQIIGNSDSRPFLYENSTMREIPGLSAARDINDRGQIAGNVGSGLGTHAAIFENGSITLKKSVNPAESAKPA